MLETEFWRLIAESRAALREAHVDIQEQSEVLKSKLISLGPQPIIEFKVVFENKFVNANSWELCAVQFLAFGIFTDTSFNAFRAWLIAQGEEVYVRGVKDPSTLADLLKEEDSLSLLDSAEYFLYCADLAYEELIGRDIWDDVPEDLQKDTMESDQTFDETNICQVYPHLCKLFGYTPS
jgi:hypothetical protein